MKTFLQFVTVNAALAICPFVHADHHLESVNPVGVWKVKASTDNGDRAITWTISKKGDELTGVTLDHESGNDRKLDRIIVKKNSVTIEIDIEQDGNKGVIRVEAEQKSPGKLDGKWSVVGDDEQVYMSGKISAVKQVAYAGTWDATSELPNGSTFETVLALAGKNDALKGEFDGTAGKTEVDKVTVTDSGLRLKFDFEMNGDTINCVIEAEAKGDDKLEGKWVVLQEDGAEGAQGKWSAVRKPQSLAGVWSVVATVPNNEDYTGMLKLSQANGKYSGVSQGSEGDETALATVKVEGKQLEFKVPFEQDGNSGTITVVAKQTDDGSLEGQWALTDGDGNELARESWKATRK